MSELNYYKIQNSASWLFDSNKFTLFNEKWTLSRDGAGCLYLISDKPWA